CAEDPARNYLPSVGTLSQWIEPTGPGVRVDSGVSRGSEVSSYYDPLLAKLIVRGEDRSQTLDRMERALREFHALGVQTNIAYLLATIRHPAFRSGDPYPRFLQDHFAGWKPSTEFPTEVLLALAAESLTYREKRPAIATSSQGDAYNPWHSQGTWRNT